MSNLATALNGAFDGNIREMGPQGMVTLRGDLGDKALARALRDATGLEMPKTGQISLNGPDGVAWMSPDELLVLCDYGQAADMTTRLSEQLGASHHLTVNVSDARSMFEVSGDWHSTLARLTPADLRDVTSGTLRRSRLAQVPAAFWQAPDNTLRIICFRSVARYVFDLLCTADRAGRL